MRENYYLKILTTANKKKLKKLLKQKMFIKKITFTKKLYNVNYLNKKNKYQHDF